MRTFIADNKEKLSRMLLDRYQGALSYSVFCKILRKKDVKINGKRVGKDVSLDVGDRVEVYFDGESPKKYSIVFEDDNILVIDKFKGYSSEQVFNDILSERGTAYFCHRLDTNTDGIMIFAKNQPSFEEIKSGFKHRSFDKIYFAVLYGTFEKKSAILTAYLKKDSANSIVRVYNNKVKDSVEIRTQYFVFEEENGLSKTLIRLLTGRTHQIRAHLAYLGHFVLGDGKYGVEKINRIYVVNKLQLTSVKLTLRFSKESPLYYLDGRCFEKSGEYSRFLIDF